MPILPLDHPEPFAATLGVMLYPGPDESEQRKARAFAAQYLAKPIQQLYETGGTLSQDDLLLLATDAGERLDNLEERWWRATATGELFKILFTLANTDLKLASWSNAIKLTELVATRSKVSGSRTALWGAKSEFHSVAHLWGAWSIREGKFDPLPEVGYDGYADFQSFLTEAEILRQWGQSWSPPRDKGKPPLPADAWIVPDDWQPPERFPGWPPTGRIPHMTLSDELLENLKPAGRPKKET
ncbi:hypothetical protein JYU02_00885 [bacterium AH-315-P15]|nr:hypothetical protein [bacterium AH-315-P15]